MDQIILTAIIAKQCDWANLLQLAVQIMTNCHGAM